MPQVNVDIEVWCNECGEGICHLVHTTGYAGRIRIEPCPTCLEKAKDEGETIGYDKGHKDGLDER